MEKPPSVGNVIVGTVLSFGISILSGVFLFKLEAAMSGLSAMSHCTILFIIITSEVLGTSRWPCSSYLPQVQKHENKVSCLSQRSMTQIFAQHLIFVLLDLRKSSGYSSVTTVHIATEDHRFGRFHTALTGCHWIQERTISLIHRS